MSRDRRDAAARRVIRSTEAGFVLDAVERKLRFLI